MDAGALLMLMLMLVFASLSVQEVGISLCLVRVRGPDYLMVIAPSSDLAEPDQVVSRLDFTPDFNGVNVVCVCMAGRHVGNGRTNE